MPALLLVLPQPGGDGWFSGRDDGWRIDATCSMEGG
jgi:hypothetical protein